jgi:outer membrane lipoprotein-sorting protein
MNKQIITKIVFVLLGTAGICWAGCSVKTTCVEPKDKRANPVDVVLTQLSQKTKQLKSYQARVEYKFIQPVFESTTLRKGELHYAKSGKKSKLRINFGILKQDDEKEQKYREEFIFDGVWLAQINYQTKQVIMRQLAEPNKPVGVFELASRNLPIVGFAGIEDLRKQFEIKLVDQKPSEQDDFIQLHLKVKPDSKYKDKYTSIDFWIDKKLGLPAKITAVSTEEDIYQIKLLKPKVNKKLRRIFTR